MRQKPPRGPIPRLGQGPALGAFEVEADGDTRPSRAARHADQLALVGADRVHGRDSPPNVPIPHLGQRRSRDAAERSHPDRSARLRRTARNGLEIPRARAREAGRQPSLPTAAPTRSQHPPQTAADSVDSRNPTLVISPLLLDAECPPWSPLAQPGGKRASSPAGAAEQTRTPGRPVPF